MSACIRICPMFYAGAGDGIKTFVLQITLLQPIMSLLFLVTIVSLFGVGLCKNTTVTAECWFDIEVKDMDGPGENYRGRFTVAVFGEAAPMTALNFVSLVKGYNRGGVSLDGVV